MNKNLHYKNGTSRRDEFWLRLAAVLVVALAGWLAVPRPARADWPLVGDTVPSGQVIDNDVLATGTDVVIDGTINGDLWAVGSTVTVNGPVSGNLLAVGGTVIVNGKVGGSTYAVGRTLNLGETADVQHNVHFAGLLLDSQPGSRIGRDLVVASVRARISSQVDRALNALILLLTFDGQIGGGVGQPGIGGLLLGDPLAGKGGILMGVALGPGGGHGLAYAAPSAQILTASLGPKAPAQQGESASGGLLAGIPGWIVARVSDLLILLLVGGLALWLRPALIERPAEQLRRKPLPAVGFGLLAAFLAFSAIILAILLAALLLIAGIWLASAGLWALAFVLCGIGFPILILALVLLVLAVLYGSKVIVADLAGTLILKRLAPRAMEHRILPLLLGLVLYVILRSIPIVGWAVDAIVTILGLGAIWIAYRDRRRPEAVGVEEQVQPAPVPEP